MEYESAGGVRVPAVGLGTWNLTGDRCRRAVATALELGYRHVDTAQRYGNEAAVGRGLAAADVDREAVFLTTKLRRRNLRPGRVRRSTRASLERLGTAYVDLLLVHVPSLTVPVEETIRAMDGLVDDGMVRHIGVSNFSIEKLERAIAASDHAILTNQVQYHPYRTRDAMLERCRRDDVILTAYSPLVHGGIVDDDRLRAVGRRYGKTPAQVAIRWLVQQDGVVTIPKASSRDHLAENLDVFDFELEPEEMRSIPHHSWWRTGVGWLRGLFGRWL